VGKPDRARSKESQAFQDITEKKQAADLRVSEELALQAISQGVMITGLQLITSVNAGFTAIWATQRRKSWVGRTSSSCGHRPRNCGGNPHPCSSGGCRQILNYHQRTALCSG
jgi:hypothetical protein